MRNLVCLDASNAATQFSTLGVGVNLIRAALWLLTWNFMLTEGQIFYRNKYLKSAHWETLRITRLAKDGGRCKICGKRDASNDVHHIQYWHLFDINCSDLRTLCRECHVKVHAVLKIIKHPKTKNSEQIWKTVRQRMDNLEKHGYKILA
jgi:hypothetical protein